MHIIVICQVSQQPIGEVDVGFAVGWGGVLFEEVADSQIQEWEVCGFGKPGVIAVYIGKGYDLAWFQNCEALVELGFASLWEAGGDVWDVYGARKCVQELLRLWCGVRFLVFPNELRCTLLSLKMLRISILQKRQFISELPLCSPRSIVKVEYQWVTETTNRFTNAEWKKCKRVYFFVF